MNKAEVRFTEMFLFFVCSLAFFRYSCDVFTGYFFPASGSESKRGFGLQKGADCLPRGDCLELAR